jgi:hypothetical protein
MGQRAVHDPALDQAGLGRIEPDRQKLWRIWSLAQRLAHLFGSLCHCRALTRQSAPKEKARLP